MTVKPQMKKVIILAWLLTVPFGIWFSFQAYPPDIKGNGLDLTAFLVLTCLVATRPLVINNTSIFLIQWVSLATFLRYGLFVELIFTQAAVVVLIAKIRLQRDQLFRLPLNLLMFFLVSLISGAVYYWLGGKTGPNLTDDYLSLSLAVLYAVLSYCLNQIIVSFNIYYIYKSKEPFFGKDFFVETITTVITFPIGFVLYFLYNEAGLLSLVFVGVPFFSLSIILNLYYSSEQINEQLQEAAEIGHQMAERLQVGTVIDLFFQKLTEMLPVDYAYIFDVNDERLKIIRRMETGAVSTISIPPIQKNEGICGLAWGKMKPYLFTRRMEWRGISNEFIPHEVESILCVPIVRNKNVIGVLLLASKRKRIYQKFQLTIIDILCSSFGIALENARNHERTKMQSERCSLTKLYNYRYFENLLTKEFEKLMVFERDLLSLIILDIDHFKSVNDTYGHQSGNEILVELAARLTVQVGKRGTVARYGGEEFVILLPDTSKMEAFEMAERIREAISDLPFTLTQSMDQNLQKVSITVSIGVATAPEDAEDSLALIRHADRALYVGAKRAGRNRVAEYSK